MELKLSVFIYAAAFLHLRHGIMAFTYWVNPDCGHKPEWAMIEEEAFSMARRAAARLYSRTDYDFANVFHIIFSVDRDNQTLFDRTEEYRRAWQNQRGTAYGTVESTLREIGEHIRVDGQEGSQEMKGADIRITCDNGHGWTPHNSPYGIFWVNDLHQVRNEPGHPRPCEDDEYGETFFLTQLDPSQNVNRSLVVLCDRSWEITQDPNDPTQNPPDWVIAHWSLASIDPGSDLGQLPRGARDLHHLISMTLLHEITHTQQYHLEDYPEPDLGYGWTNVYHKSTRDALWNSDSYAYLGLFALLADRQVPPTQNGRAYPNSGYTLWRPSDRFVAYRNLQNEEGHFRAYTDVTR